MNKLAGLKTFDDHLQERYGDKTAQNVKILRQRQKHGIMQNFLKMNASVRMSPKDVGRKIGKKREYISALEKGQTDMQLSTFLKIADALGLRFSLVLG